MNKRFQPAAGRRVGKGDLTHRRTIEGAIGGNDTGPEFLADLIQEFTVLSQELMNASVCVEKLGRPML